MIAIDVPSGLDADRGCWVGGVEGVHASETITFIADKPGLHTGDGVDAAGAVTLDRLGVEPVSTRIYLSDPSDFAQISVPRRRNTHKGSYGNALVIGAVQACSGRTARGARCARPRCRSRVRRLHWRPGVSRRSVPDRAEFRPYASIENAHAIVIGCVWAKVMGRAGRCSGHSTAMRR